MDPFSPDQLPVQIDWERLIRHIGPANRALAYFNGALYGLPNPEVFLIPLTTQEAVLLAQRTT